MKKKNRINPIEQHFEKVILVGVSGVLLGVVSMQFLTQPNAVKVGNKPDPVPPGDVFDVIVGDAENLLAEIRNPSPTLPEIPEQNVAKRFEQARTLTAGQELKLANFGTTVDIKGADIGPGPELAATTYAMPALPVPATVAGATFRAAIDPIEAINNEALKPYLPKEQPFDALAVSIEGSISGDSLRESLQTDPDGDGPASPLPLMWWRGNIDLLGVEVQREELTTGGWGNATIVSGTPGGFSAIEEARTPDITPTQLLKVAEDSREFLGEIVHPDFPRTVAGPEWVRPSEIVEDTGLTDEERTVARLMKQYETLNRGIATNEERRAELGGGGGGGEAGNERSRGRGGEGGGGGQTSDPTKRQRDNLQRTLDSQYRTLDRVLRDLADLDVFPEQDDDDNNRDEPEALPVFPILEAEDMPVWTHDFTAQPGKTYRYRMRVVLNNPLFGRALYLSDAQKAAADSPTIEGDWSSWTDPIAVERDRQFFVVSASENDQLGSGPRAAVEVYQFYYGYWRKGSATLSPGDSIHARTRLPDNLLIWDPEKLKDLGRLPRPGVVRPGDPSRGFDPRDPRGVAPGNERELRGLGDPRNPDRPLPPRPGEEPALPEGAQPGPDSLQLDVAAMLLDVVRLPGGDGTAVQAVIRGPDGSIITRNASADRSGPLYQRLADNARAGEEAGRPEPEPDQGRPNQREERELEDPGNIPSLPGG